MLLSLTATPAHAGSVKAQHSSVTALQPTDNTIVVTALGGERVSPWPHQRALLASHMAHTSATTPQHKSIRSTLTTVTKHLMTAACGSNAQVFIHMGSSPSGGSCRPVLNAVVAGTQSLLLRGESATAHSKAETQVL